MARRKSPELAAMVARRVREIRTSRGLSQEDLAARCGVTVETVNRTERARLVPTLVTLDSMARALGVGLADLLDPERLVPQPELEARDRALVEQWKRLAPSAQDAVEAIVRELVQGPPRSSVR